METIWIGVAGFIFGVVAYFLGRRGGDVNRRDIDRAVDKLDDGLERVGRAEGDIESSIDGAQHIKSEVAKLSGYVGEDIDRVDADREKLEENLRRFDESIERNARSKELLAELKKRLNLS